MLWRYRAFFSAGGAHLKRITLIAGFWLVGTALSYVLLEQVNWSLESHGLTMWFGLALLAFVVGWGLGRATPNLIFWDLCFAALVYVHLGVLFVWCFYADQGLASAQARLVLISPFLLLLFSFFGASLGHVLHNGGFIFRNSYEFMVGRRFLLEKSSPVLSTVTAIALIGVALGVWLIIVSLAVLSGFEQDLEKKIIGANAHLVIEHRDDVVFKTRPVLEDRIKAQPGIAALAPVVQGDVAVASRSNYSGVVLFGVNQKATDVLGVLSQVVSGQLPDFSTQRQEAPVDNGSLDFKPASLPEIVIGYELARTLNVRVGDSIRLISPVHEVLTPLGAAPRSMGYRVAAIFESKMYDFDARYVYTSLSAARRLFQMAADDISGFQLKLRDVRQPGPSVQALEQDLGADYRVQDWQQRNQTLYASLKLERVVAMVVLVFIVLVASFAVVNTLTMSVIEKREQIAILKTMGAPTVGIMKVFLSQGLLVGFLGTLVGTVLGTLTVTFLDL
ncbi:MAG: ABC transporter permease, partial [Myxococcota bacterium]|nr:ABC transporter permease [Myxococcota bacterium]